MVEKLLLPHKFKRVGWFILIPAFIIGLLLLITNGEFIEINTKIFAVYSDKLFENKQYFNFIETNIIPTIIGVLFIIGALLVAFSKEKEEDEFIANLRLTSLLWSVLINYLLLLFAFLFVYGIGFLNIMVFNIFTVLLIFIIKFNFSLYRNSKYFTDEKYY